MSVTLKDISKVAGVSIAAVSRALNGKDKEINFNTKQKILEAAEKLNYNFREKKAITSRNIGIVSQFLLARGVLKKRSAGFYNILFGFIEKWLRFYGYNTFFSSYDEEEIKQGKVLQIIRDRIITGLLIIGPVSENFLDILKKHKIPFVLINYRIKSGHYNTVCSNDFAGAYNLTRYLIKLGHHKIAFIKEDSDDSSFSERFRGFLEAFIEKEGHFDKEMVVTEAYNANIGYRSIINLFKKSVRPTAVFAVNDYIGMNVVKALKDLKLQIPGDVSVVGFDAGDDLPIDPPLTSAKVYEEEMAKVAVERLLKIIREDVPAMDICLSTPIVHGSSCGPKK
ncbi:MAG: LacI family DNA-binding transcriptional regulator [Spirochaetes bacterium]|nr:LacI family DNA-binding transcriptional regulator [Spirochaetota bacterium]